MALTVQDIFFPSFTLGIMIAGLVVFGFLAGHRRDNTAYRGVLSLVVVALASVAFDVAVLVLTVRGGPEQLGFYLDRLRELANSGFLFAVPFGLFAILPTGKPERQVAGITWRIGLTLFAANVIVAFGWPELFVSITERLQGPGASVYSTTFGRGQTGTAFVIRDGLLGVMLLVALVISGWGILSKSIRGSNLLVAVGVVIGVSLGADALYANFTGSYLGPLRDFPFSRVTTATTVFTVLSIVSYVIRFVSQSMSLDIANKELAIRRDELSFLAYHNARTRMPNKQSAMRDIDKLIRAREEPVAGECYLCSLDSLSIIEDSFGSTVSEHVLGAIGRRIEELVGHIPDGEVRVYHVEGSSFLVLTDSLISEGARESLESGLLRSTSAALSVGEEMVYPSAVIGHCELSRDAGGAEGIIRRLKRSIASDEATPGTVRRYSAEIHAEVGENQGLIQRLRAAVERDDFTMLYQPIIDRDGGICAAEALIRWSEANTERFITLAEQSGLIVPITDFVTRTICSDISALRAAHPDIEVHMNVSARHVHQVDIQDQLESCLAHNGLDAGAIGVEITETSFFEQSQDILSVLHRLREAGFGVAIDDFGTGYSSLSYLKQIPADRLKIDRSFVMTLPESREDRALVDAAIVLGHELGKQVVAEGVETEHQRVYLHEHDVDFFQGYLFSRPLTVDGLAALDPPGQLSPAMG